MKLFYNHRWRQNIYLPIVLIFYFCFHIQVIQAQSDFISGKIVDEAGIELPGVSVQVKGEKTVTITDLNGKFNLNTSNDKIIVFSYIGFQKKELQASQANNTTIALELDSKTLTETVVIGYGSVKKKDITGSVSSLNVTDLQKAPVNSFGDALAGRVAGVQVSSIDGQPGDAPNIVIRGNSSLTQDNSPLYVIDGLPIENLNGNAINPSDIESMEILKDASATAIYGSRGANGVVIITTKKGVIGKPVFTLDYRLSQGQNIKNQNLLSPYEFLKLHNDKSPDLTKAMYFSNSLTLDSYQNNPGISWEDMLLQKANQYNVNMSLRGATEGTNYSIAGSIANQDGIIINSGLKRYQGRINITQKIGSKLTVGANVNYANIQLSGVTVRDYSSGNTGGNPAIALMANVWGYRPIANANDNAVLVDEGIDPTANPTTDYRYNPIKTIKNTINTTTKNNLTAQGTLDYNILPNLTFKYSGSLNRDVSGTNMFYNSNTQNGDRRTPQGVNGPNGSINSVEMSILASEATLTYKKLSTNGHNLTLLAGASDQTTSTFSTGFSANNVPNDVLGVYGLSQGTLTGSTSYLTKSALVSYFGRTIYDYKSKYYLTASYRADGSSKLSSVNNNNWGYFPSAALSWRLSSEDFMKSLTFIHDAKLRASYGLTGNNRVTDFAYMASTQVMKGYYSFGSALQSGAFRTTLENPDLKWETTKQANLGVDLELFDGRVGIIADYYKKTTNNLLLNTSMPGSSGFGTAMINVGSVENSGFEFTLNTTNIRTKDFSWMTSFNISFNRNKILDLAFGQDALIVNNNYISKVGSPIGQMYGYVNDGLYQVNDFILNNNGKYTLKNELVGNGGPRASILPGNVKFKDLNGDGIIDSKDQTIIGNGNPLHTGGFTNNFSYKGFDLNIFFQWSYGNDIMNANRVYFESYSPAFNYNQFATAALGNRWTPDNTTATMPITGGTNGYTNIFSSRIIEDGSFIRLKTIQLGYTLPSKVSNKLGANSFNIYASAQNIMTWTKYSGVDPEVSTYNSPLSPGYDYSAYPKARTISLGIKLTL